MYMEIYNAKQGVFMVLILSLIPDG